MTQPHLPHIPNVLAIAGSDPSGGAGIQADIKAICANGGYAMAAITALTAQSTRGVSDIRLLPPAFVAAQIAAVLADIRVDAIKIGMLGTAEITEAIAKALRDHPAPVILDTVMRPKGGNTLLATDALPPLRDLLLPICDIVTPNLPEAAVLLGCAEATSRAEMEAQARALRDLGARAVYLKGGHLAAEDCPDLFFTDAPLWIEAPRIATKNTHGTGCTLASALATQRAHGLPPAEAAKAAKAYTLGAIRAADGLSVGQGHGPTDHFFAMRK
ncbi:bifunctional hydroxymethylpyrimidine kinase/phosphomethylpyrimidine kinase [Thioclava sp. A2]|uniref:bifunctional hydroxymethylpyrimidine kinase/phosphomethylpyrimidine kinase n=1 Tax=Thioclava sp. FCG-A2 TaxID=3080562 RepID=UPI002952E72B|nr:bifunctional hydroxymethylpyrimidine kinase/phosphomethylpyrimidine kinase [Thioclava sp. A2]MDV7270878.1 bifunctional hydroxymethylpyrimidine kinase/phosphomethylpyrimidine kinase [Thioclava sp. A2]